MLGRQLRSWYRNGHLKGCFYSCSQQPVVREGVGATSWTTLPLLFRRQLLQAGASLRTPAHPGNSDAAHARAQAPKWIQYLLFSHDGIPCDLSIGPTLPALVCGSGPYSMTETFCPSPLLSIFPQLSICSESPKHVLATSTRPAHS